MSLTTKTKVIAGFIIAVLISAGGCFLSYRYLKSVSAVVVELSDENMRTTSVKKMLRTIDLAEAEVDGYILNKRGSKLDTVNTILSDLLKEVDHLKLLCRNDPAQLNNVNSIDSLINSQVEWYYNFIRFKNKGASDVLFKNLSEKLAVLYKAGVKKTVSVMREPEVKEKKGFFQKMFKSKKENQEPVTKDTVIVTAPDPQKTTAQINKILNEAQNTQIQNQKASNSKELGLLKENKILKNRLYEEINRFEANEINEAKQKAVISKAEANKAILALTAITTLGGLTFILFSFLIVRDITRSNKLRKELLAAKAEALRLAQAKEEFLANMSHEIRTPLNSIIGFAEQLNSSPVPDKEKYASTIHKSSHHLLNLVNDILDFSKINLGKITIEKIPFSIKEVLNDMVEVFRPHATKKGLSFRCIMDETTSPLTLEGDPHRLKQILINLISNAIKFTEKGHVELIVTHKQLTDNTVELQVQVKDTGIGINAKSLAKIFNSFDQADNSITRKFGGTGLGLSICKQLAKIQGGEITVVSQLGSGSEFTLTIPYMLTTTVNPEANGKAVLSAVYDHALEKTNLLVVDDDEMSMLLLSTILEKNGIPHKTAVDGKDAILKIKTNNFDLILTDVNMPEISGLDLLKQVKKNTGKKTPVPVIAITANINKNDVEKYKQSGFDAVLLKPYLEEDLLKLIYKYAHVEATEKKNGISSNGHRPAQEKETSFSLDQLNRISNGSEEFIIKMLEKFIVSAGECSENMEGAMAAKDWARLRTAAHKSIPSYSMMGLKDLTEKLQFIELNSRTGQEHEEIPGMVSFISEKNKKIISDIEQYLAVIAEKNKKIN